VNSLVNWIVFVFSTALQAALLITIFTVGFSELESQDRSHHRDPRTNRWYSVGLLPRNL